MRIKHIRDDRLYNIIRTQGKAKSIFMQNLPGKEARKQLMHWKRRARDAKSDVFFSAVPVPPELAPRKKSPVSEETAA